MTADEAFAALDDEDAPPHQGVERFDDDIFSGAADINDDNGIHYGNPNDPVDNDKYVPMYDRNLSATEQQAWDALVKSEMEAMELEYKEEAEEQMKPLERKDGKYGNYKQTGQVNLDIQQVSNAGVKSGGFGARKREDDSVSQQSSLDQCAYDRAHPVTIAATHGGGAAHNVNANLRRVTTPQNPLAGTILSGIGSSQLSSAQKKQKQLQLYAQVERDRHEREMRIQQSPVPADGRQVAVDRSYRAMPQAPGDDFSSSMDRLVASSVSRDDVDVKRRKQAEYHEQLRLDKENQQAITQRTAREQDQRILQAHPPADMKPSYAGRTDFPASPDDKRAAQAKYREQLKQQTSANEREKAVKQTEIQERRMQQQRDRDLETMRSEEDADIAERQQIELTRRQSEKERIFAVREAAEKLSRDEDAANARRKLETARQAAREKAESGGVLPGGTFQVSLPMAERAEHDKKLQLLGKNQKKDEEVIRALQNVSPYDSNNAYRQADGDRARVRANEQDSFSSNSKDVFHGMGDYQKDKANKGLRKNAQEAYVRALKTDSQQEQIKNARVGLRQAREEPDYYVRDNVMDAVSSSLPRSGKASSMAEPNLKQSEVGWGPTGTLDAHQQEKRRQQALYAKQLQDDKQQQTIFSPRKTFVRHVEEEDRSFSSRSSNTSLRSARQDRNDVGYWPESQSGAGGFFANGLQSMGPSTKQSMKKSSQIEFQDQLARDADVRGKAKEDEAQRQQIENHRSSRNIGRPNSDVGGRNGGFIGAERTEVANQPARGSLRQVSLSQPERTGFPFESQQISTAARAEENQSKRQDYLAKLQSDEIERSSPRAEQSRMPLNELKKREMLVGGYPDVRATGGLVGKHPEETGMRIGLSTADRQQSERRKLDAYNEARKSDENTKAIEQTRRVSPRRPEPAVKRAQQQAEQLRQLESTGARLTETERELLGMYNMSLQLESMSSETNSEYASYNRSRSEMNSNFDAAHMGSSRMANTRDARGNDAADAHARKRQQQRDYVDSVEQARNQPAITQTRVPLLQIRRDEEENHRASLPGASSILVRAGSAGAEESQAQLSARQYQIQRSNDQAAFNVQQQAHLNGSVADVMAQGLHKNLPNWGRSVGGGVSSFSINGAAPNSAYGSGAPATGFNKDGDNWGYLQQQQEQQLLSPRSQRIARRGDPAALKDTLFNNPLGY